VSGAENTKTDDWEAAGTIACGAGAAIGVNALGVEFRSRKLNVRNSSAFGPQAIPSGCR